MKLGTRLTLSYLALILVGMGILTPLTWLAVERLYVDTQKANLLAQAEEQPPGCPPGLPCPATQRRIPRRPM